MIIIIIIIIIIISIIIISIIIIIIIILTAVLNAQKVDQTWITWLSTGLVFLQRH